MFFHNYKYRVKCIIRDKQMMFWSFFFPVILATLFNLAFTNIASAEKFSSIDIAIVEDGNYDEKDKFLEIISSVSGNEDNEELFDIEYKTKDEAGKLLEDDKIEGYVFFDDEINVVVKKSGINQTILKSFVEEYLQTSSTIKRIIKENPESMQKDLNSIFENKNFIEDVNISNAEPNVIANYFYALIAMACFYGSFLGVKEVLFIQANQSSQAARVNMAPTNKLKIFLASMAAAITIQFLAIMFLMAYLLFILNVSFGDRSLYIFITCVVGSIAGVTFGTFVGAITKKSEGTKIGILVGITMVLSFLSGLMVHKVKYIVNTNVPILGYLNPVNLISDSFYSLYFYDTLDKFYMNMGLLCGFIIIFSSVTYLILRRQKYASL